MRSWNMSDQIRNTLSQDGNQTIAKVPNRSLTPKSNRSSFSSSSDEETNVVSQNTIVSNVSNSNNVHIRNTSSNFYNAPVVINNIYQQYDTIEQLPAETIAAPEISFSKRFFSAIRSRVSKNCSTKYYVTIPIVLLVVILLIIGLIFWLLGLDQSQQNFNAPNNTSDPCDLQIVSRNEWNALPRRNREVPLKSLPAMLVIICHTVTTLCYYLEQCIISVKLMQIDHMEKTHHWDDIGYNFLVGGDGFVYEGRGWNIEGSHTFRYNNQSIGIALIGTFDKEEPTKPQLKTVQKLIEYGVENGYISPYYKLLANRQCRIGTGNPGDALYTIMKTWAHWSYMCPKVLK